MVYVYTKPMPGFCHEMVSQNDDGSYTIVINDVLSKVEQAAAYRHALLHIRKGHFDFVCDLTADEMEMEAHAEEESGRKI